jgi:hypothetical protein
MCLMNERIQELFKLIRKSKHTSNLMSKPPQVRYSYTIDEEDIKKFAELIVQECAEQSMSIGRYNTPSGITPDLSIAISVGLKKHFGVEE